MVLLLTDSGLVLTRPGHFKQEATQVENSRLNQKEDPFVGPEMYAVMQVMIDHWSDLTLRKGVQTSLSSSVSTHLLGSNADDYRTVKSTVS